MGKETKIHLVIAGGTIGMLFNERYGGYIPSLKPEELIKKASLDNTGIEVTDWSNYPSSHYTADMMFKLVQFLREKVSDKSEPLVVTFGTDSMEEMAYLTDLLWIYPHPVVYTGALFTFDSTGYDGTKNLSDSIAVAQNEDSWGHGVMLCLNSEIHAATSVSKVQSFNPSAFASPEDGQIGEVIHNKVTIRKNIRRTPPVELIKRLENRVELIKATVGASDHIIQSAVDNCAGIVIEAFGCGNIPPNWVSYLRHAIRNGSTVIITTRCIKGPVVPAYSFEGGGHKLKEMGAIMVGHISGIKARIKLMVALGAGMSGEALRTYMLS